MGECCKLRKDPRLVRLSYRLLSSVLDSKELADIYMEVGIGIKDRRQSVFLSPASAFFLEAAEIYKMLGLDVKSKGALMFSFRECIKDNEHLKLKLIKRLNNTGQKTGFHGGGWMI